MTNASLGPGQEIAGRYTIESVLGEGGMGTVFAATQAFTGRRVAVKVLHEQWARDEMSVQRFVQEARIVAQLSHASIAQVLDGGVDPQHGVFLVMERLEGTTLQQWLDEHKVIDIEQLRRWLVPVMNALAVAHSSDVVHRDVKPENIFLARQSDDTITAKLLDFGMSKLTANRDALLKTSTGAVVGTAWYMSPEQARGTVDIDPRTDVWSMGVVLYQCLTGVRPFEGGTLPAVIAGILTRDPAPLESLREGLPPALCDVVMRALQKDRDARVSSMRALAYEVDRAVRASQESVAYAQTVPHSANVSQQIRAALAVVEGTIPPDSPAAIEAQKQAVPPNTLAIPAVVIKRVTSEANASKPSKPVSIAPRATTVELEAKIDGPEPESAPPVVEQTNPVFIVLVTALIVAVVVVTAVLLLKK